MVRHVPSAFFDSLKFASTYPFGSSEFSNAVVIKMEEAGAPIGVHASNFEPDDEKRIRARSGRDLAPVGSHLEFAMPPCSMRMRLMKGEVR